MNEATGQSAREIQQQNSSTEPEMTLASAAPAESNQPLGDECPAGTALEAPPERAESAEPTPERQDSEGTDRGWVGSLQSLIITVIIALFVITFIVQAFQIPSESMENTLLIGDYLLVDKAHYGPGGPWKWLLPYGSIRRGDIIVFRYPVAPEQHFVKRVVGIPGDRVRLVHRRVYVNGQLVSEPYAVYRSQMYDSFRDNFPDGDSAGAHISGNWYLQMRALTEDRQLIVPSDSYFVMGDNRDESLDSRYWGFVPRENILGRPLMIYWSVKAKDPGDEDAQPDGKLARLRMSLRQGWADLRWHRMFTLVR